MDTVNKQQKTARRGGAISRRPYGIPLPSLREWRYYRSLTQKELADLAHMTVPTLSGVELGKTTSFSTARKLAEALNLSVDALRYSVPPERQPEHVRTLRIVEKEPVSTPTAATCAANGRIRAQKTRQ